LREASRRKGREVVVACGPRNFEVAYETECPVWGKSGGRDRTGKKNKEIGALRECTSREVSEQKANTVYAPRGKRVEVNKLPFLGKEKERQTKKKKQRPKG